MSFTEEHDAPGRETAAEGMFQVWIDAGHIDWESTVEPDFGDPENTLDEDIADDVRLGLRAIQFTLQEKYPHLNLQVTYDNRPLD